MEFYCLPIFIIRIKKIIEDLSNQIHDSWNIYYIKKISWKRFLPLKDFSKICLYLEYLFTLLDSITIIKIKKLFFLSKIFHSLDNKASGRNFCSLPYYFFHHFRTRDLGLISRQKVSTPSIKSKWIYVSIFPLWENSGDVFTGCSKLSMKSARSPAINTSFQPLCLPFYSFIPSSETRSNGTALRNWNGETFQSDRVPATPFVQAFVFFRFFFLFFSPWFL